MKRSNALKTAGSMSWIVLHVELCLEDPRPGCEHNHLNHATIPPIEPATDRAHRTPQAPCTRAAALGHQPCAPGASRPYARARAHPACSPLGYLQHGGMGLHRLSPPRRKNFISIGDPIPSIVHRATSPWPCRGGPASPLPVELEPPLLPVPEEKGEGVEEPRRGGVELKLEPPPLCL
jgi:hypothetical protein